jgi:1,2-phenylacetyl-CoA epoxidase catalytic subunit
MRKIETVEQMPEEYKNTLIKVIYALASTEFASVEQHQPWINQGPTPEDRYIQAQIAADEAHQGFIDSRMLRSFGPEGDEKAAKLLKLRMGEHLLSAFNVPFESWVDVCGFCFTLDLVAWYHLRAMENCSFAPLAREMTTMVGEERFHASFGARRIHDIVRDPEYARLCGATKRMRKKPWTSGTRRRSIPSARRIPNSAPWRWRTASGAGGMRSCGRCIKPTSTHRSKPSVWRSPIR